MTSEPDSTSRRPPPTIDLKATEVGPEKPAGEAGDTGAAARAPSSSAGSAKTYLTIALAGIAGGAIGAAVIGSGLWFLGYIPPHTPAVAASAPAANDQAVADIQARLAKIESAPQPQPQQQQGDPARAARLAAAEAAVKSLNDQLAELNGHVDDVTGAAQNALTQAKAASAAADAVKSAAQSAAQGGVARSDLDALNARIATLDSAIKKLTDDIAHQPRSADDRAARLTVVAEALRAAVDRSAPFQAELAAVKSLGADQNAIAALEPFAATGLPSAAALAHELAALVPALQQAVAPVSNSFLGRLEANAKNLVQITPIDAPAGDDPASVVTRIDVEAERADIAAALIDIGKLPDAAKPVVAAWAQKAQARQAAIAASQKLAADALAALNKPNPQ
jgi:hypothetical protein